MEEAGWGGTAALRKPVSVWGAKTSCLPRPRSRGGSGRGLHMCWLLACQWMGLASRDDALLARGPSALPARSKAPTWLFWAASCCC